MHTYVCLLYVCIYIVMHLCTYLMYEIICSYLVIALEITNGPMDTIVRNGSIANISCGFEGVDPNFAPSWRIIRRSDDGRVISNMIISAVDIITDENDDLEWVNDTASGANMSPNSRLLVGPVDETYNQSSYQCIFAFGSNVVESSIGTLMVAGEYKHLHTDLHRCVYHIISSYG